MAARDSTGAWGRTSLLRAGRATQPPRAASAARALTPCMSLSAPPTGGHPATRTPLRHHDDRGLGLDDHRAPRWPPLRGRAGAKPPKRPLRLGPHQRQVSAPAARSVACWLSAPSNTRPRPAGAGARPGGAPRSIATAARCPRFATELGETLAVLTNSRFAADRELIVRPYSCPVGARHESPTVSRRESQGETIKE